MKMTLERGGLPQVGLHFCVNVCYFVATLDAFHLPCTHLPWDVVPLPHPLLAVCPILALRTARRFRTARTARAHARALRSSCSRSVYISSDISLRTRCVLPDTTALPAPATHRRNRTFGLPTR